MYDLAVAAWAIPVTVVVATVYVLRGDKYPPIVRAAVLNRRVKVIIRA